MAVHPPAVQVHYKLQPLQVNNQVPRNPLEVLRPAQPRAPQNRHRVPRYPPHRRPHHYPHHLPHRRPHHTAQVNHYLRAQSAKSTGHTT